MKIAVVGAGWYGCSIALELSKDFPESSIDLYDKAKDIFQGAASNNQNRIHKGFHYPKSNETIKEITDNYPKFMDKYSHLVKDVKENYYLIEKGSHVSLEEYIRTYEELDIPFRIIDNFEIEPFINTEFIEGGISTQEQVVDPKASYEYFKSEIEKQKNINLKLKTKVTDIDGKYIDDERYDFIINCTYSNPNLGIKSKDKMFDLKYEVCIIAVVENIFKEDICITIMDGPFVSAYQDGQGNITLSSVLRTPYYKTMYLNEFLSKVERDSLYKDIVLKPNIYNLLIHCGQYFKNIDKHTPLKELYFSPKVKLKNDNYDLRTSSITRDKNVISVLCGKISSVVSVYELIKKEIQNGN